jgi:hypothetical protein
MAILKRFLSPIVSECIDEYIQKSLDKKEFYGGRYKELLRRHNNLIAEHARLERLNRKLSVACRIIRSEYDASYDIEMIESKLQEASDGNTLV